MIILNRRLILSALLWLPMCSVIAEPLASFSSDGCSAFPDGTAEQKQLWLGCCTRHDLAYWQGGSFQQRLDADRALHDCVDDVGQPAIANLMLAGVRVGGTPLLPSSFRWGYGWPYPRFYRQLSEREQRQVNIHLDGLIQQADIIKK
jgi:hypothetical protein